jgi:hypothetical protein
MPDQKDDTQLEYEARQLIVDIMLVLQKHCFNLIHMGGLMRLIGVSNEKAATQDDDLVELDEKFTKYIKQLASLSTDSPNKTLH